FEPHFVHMKALLDEGSLGHIYSVRMFYGNGTARLVRQSPWRDKGAGVLMDLGSHLLDTCAFWFGSLDHRAATLVSANRFENQAPDHCAFVFPGQPLLQLEMTLLSWRNHFYADVHGEKGSAHIQSLCKWGPSIFTRRNRILPSGRPTEHSVTLVQDDPTWALEYRHFLELTRTGTGNIRNDILLNRTLRHLSRSAPMASPS
ncbi:MAG: Gfo/Idh/MocA family oxidoreductase, partial [Hoeflea sp.]